MKTPDEPIIEKALSNEASPEEAKTVVRWFGTPDGQNWLSERMDADNNGVKEGTEEDYIDHPIPSDTMFEKIMEKVRKQKIRRIFLSVAAIVIPVLMLAGLYVELNSRVDLFSSAEYDEIFVPKGEQLQFMFQDGSRVYLNSESRLRYPRKFGMSERKVELEGEGFFEIAKKKNRPFIVDLNAINIKVLGTTFDAKAYPEDAEIQVSLESGTVELNGPTFQTFAIQPGDRAFYNKKSGRCRVERPIDIKSSSVWKENMLIFTDTPLADVISTLMRTFNVTFEVENDVVLKYNYTLRTSNKDLLLVIKELEKIAPVQFTEMNGVIKVSMKE